MTRKKPTKPSPAPKAQKRVLRKTAPQQSSRNPLDAFIAAGAQALGLTIEKQWMPEIRSHLAVTLRHGVAVAAFQFPDDSEPAPVFEP